MTRKPDRLLQVDGVSFRYSDHFAFECERDDDSTSWTLDGNDTVIALRRFGKPGQSAAVLQETVASLAEIYGKGAVKRKPVSIRLAGRTMNGTRVTAAIAGTTLNQDLYAFDAGGATHLLMVQDTPDDQGRPSAEMLATTELLKTSFALADAQ